MRNIYIALAAIVLLFLGTRLAKISEIPPSLYWDEASIGYNAYSVLKTGKDEWGEALPLHFRAFGEFKLPVYIYSVGAAEVFLGLSETAVRLPAVIYSLGILVLVYLIASHISKKLWVGVLSAFILSISPWLFIFSRTGYEATAGLMFFLLGLYLFLRSGKRKLFLLGGVVSWILSVYSYNSFRILVPLTGLFMTALFFKEVKGSTKEYWKIGLISFLLAAASILPIAKLYIKDTGGARFQTVAAGSLSGFARNYISHFSPSFLITGGDTNPRSQQPGFGELYLLDIPLVFLGLLYFLKRKDKINWLLLFILLASPVPAAITRESPHALRAITMAPIITIICSLGAFYLGDIVPRYRNYIFLVTVVLYLGFFESYAQAFFETYPEKTSQDWQYGYQKLFSDYAEEIARADKVIISDEYAQPYIFAAFYSKYDPASFQEKAVRNSPDKWGASSVSSFDKFVFKKTEEKDLAPGTLVFATQKDKLSLEPISEIRFLDGSGAFWVYLR